MTGIAPASLSFVDTYPKCQLVVEHGEFTDLTNSGFDGAMWLQTEELPIFISSRNSGIINVSRQDLKSILEGNIQNWTSLGGVDAPVHIYIHPGALQHAKIFELLVETLQVDLQQDSAAKVIVPDVKDYQGEYAGYEALRDAASRDAGALVFGLRSMTQPNLRSIAVDGEFLGQAGGNYPLSMPIYVYWHDTDEGNEVLSDYLEGVHRRKLDAIQLAGI